MSISRISRSSGSGAARRAGGGVRGGPAAAGGVSGVKGATFVPQSGPAVGRGVAGPGSAQGADGVAGVVGAASVGGVGAMLALQGGAGEAEQTKREAGQRAGSILEALEAVQLALLAGGEDAGALESLRRLQSAARVRTGDAGFDQLMGHVDVRAAVELAKRETTHGGGAGAPKHAPAISDASSDPLPGGKSTVLDGEEPPLTIAEWKKGSIYRPGSGLSKQGERE